MFKLVQCPEGNCGLLFVTTANDRCQCQRCGRHFKLSGKTVRALSNDLGELRLLYEAKMVRRIEQSGNVPGGWRTASPA